MINIPECLLAKIGHDTFRPTDRTAGQDDPCRGTLGRRRQVDDRRPDRQQPRPDRLPRLQQQHRYRYLVPDPRPGTAPQTTALEGESRPAPGCRPSRRIPCQLRGAHHRSLTLTARGLKRCTSHRPREYGGPSTPRPSKRTPRQRPSQENTRHRQASAGGPRQNGENH